ncbi:MAG: hypothetical protein ACFCUX_10575 [Candidatus Methylacidiphilales bacterium]
MTAETELELKQKLCSLSDDERRGISAYLIRLRHSSPSGQKEISGLMAQMDSGEKTPLSALKSQLGHG